VVVCIDSFNYFGTDDLYLNYLSHFIRNEGMLAFVSAGLAREFGGHVPDHLERLWTGDYWTLHTSPWWREHVRKTGLFDVSFAGEMPDGWRLWLDWAVATYSAAWYRDVLRADGGRYLGYVGLVAQRIGGQPLARHAWPATLRFAESRYVPHPLLRPDQSEPGRLSSLLKRLRPRR
jgi:hypothetical protein